MADKVWGFSVSVSQLDSVIGYIQHQEEHHRKMTFQEEFVVLRNKYGIAYDPRFYGRKIQPSLSGLDRVPAFFPMLKHWAIFTASLRDVKS